jgi:hypothetical protein
MRGFAADLARPAARALPAGPPVGFSIRGFDLGCFHLEQKLTASNFEGESLTSDDNEIKGGHIV